MTMTENKNQIDLLIRTFKMMERMNKNQPDVPRSHNLYYQMLTKYYTNIKNAHEQGKTIAAHTVFFPTELLYAMDIVPLHTETTTWLTALFLNKQGDFLSKGSEIGLSPEVCSPHRGAAGMFGMQAMTKPDIFLWSNLICDNSAKAGELLAELTDSKSFFLDNPFQNSPGEMEYLQGELQDMIDFLEVKSGRKMDWKKLAEIVAASDHDIELYREIGNLRKSVPCPMSILGYLELLAADYLFPGQPECTEYLTQLRDELKAMVNEGRGVVKPERFRLMTLFLPPLFLIGYLHKLYTEFNAVSCVEPLFTRWSDGRLDPSKPLESVARKSFMLPERRSMYGPLSQDAISDITDAVDQYKLDGAVFWAFMGCRHTCATIKLIKEALAEKDVPMLTIDCDIVDPTINSEPDIRAKLEQFFELLGDR